ncbi:hypothetical protein Tco_1167527, partial [Tanacetum coccineum]
NECDAFDSDVDEGPTSQTMFMANLTSEEAGASYDSNRVGGQNRVGNLNPAVLDKEQLLFLAGEQVTNFDDDVDDVALNVDHVFEADECDAFDSDVDEGPTTQTMFMANLTSEEARASYDSNIPSKVQDREYDSDCEDKYHEVHEMQSDVQHNYVVDSDADYMIDSNIILYNQYVEDNEEHVVQSNVSSVRNDALMSILDEMHEQRVAIWSNVSKIWSKIKHTHTQS